MSDRPKRERTLPPGYQFGDAARFLRPADLRPGDILEGGSEVDPVTMKATGRPKQFTVHGTKEIKNWSMK